MLDACSKTPNARSVRCTHCGALPAEIHEAGPLFNKRPYCAQCCPVCAPAQAKPKASVGEFASALLAKVGLARPKIKPPIWDTPSAPRPRDPFYFDERRIDRGVDYLQPGGATRLRRGR